LGGPEYVAEAAEIIAEAYDVCEWRGNPYQHPGHLAFLLAEHHVQQRNKSGLLRRYKLTPAEAMSVELEEPDWRKRFEEHCLRWPKLPRYLAEDNAFEAVLKDWRRFHFSWGEVEGKPARIYPGSPAGCIALAQLKIFPPRFTIKDVPRTDEGGYQRDDHMWLSISGEQWRVTTIEDRMLHLEKGFEEPRQAMQIDLNRARWTKYTESAVAALKQRGP
jgi:hypothetical protein